MNLHEVMQHLVCECHEIASMSEVRRLHHLNCIVLNGELVPRGTDINQIETK